MFYKLDLENTNPLKLFLDNLGIWRGAYHGYRKNQFKEI